MSRAQCSPNPNSDLTPCECAEERRARRIRACTCLSRRRVCTRPRLDRAPQVARSAAEGRRHQGRLFLAYLILAKQKKVSRPPRRQSGTGTRQSASSSTQRKALTGSARTDAEAQSNSEAGVFGVRAQIPQACGSPCGCCASLAAKLRSDPQNHYTQYAKTSPQPISLQMNTRLGIADALHQPNPLQDLG